MTRKTTDARAGVPADATSVLVFGGTFDPPHIGHIELPTRARDAAGFDHLLYIPAGRSPFKASNPEASDADRLAMLNGALADDPRASVSAIELGDADDEGLRPPSYTVQTLERLSDALGPGVRLGLLIGADQASSFHKWKRAARIMELAPPVVMLRAPAESREALLDGLAAHWDARAMQTWASGIVELPTIDASATEVRDLLAQEPGAERDARLAELLPEPVRRHIQRAGLYPGRDQA